MDCREFLLRYSDYDDSLIPAAEAERFSAHLSECASCARYDRVLRKGRMLARQLSRPEPSPDFIPRLQLRLLQVRSGRGRWKGAGLAAGLAAVTVLMVATAAVQLMGSAGDASDAPGAGAVTVQPVGPTGAGSGRPAFVPAAGLAMLSQLSSTRPATPRAWVTRTVATADTASYSPLVTGPPVFRVAHRPPGRTTHTRRALD